MVEFERVRAAVHDALMAGGDVRRVLSVLPDDPETARRMLDTAMADYASELARALADGSGHLYGQSATEFMRQYDTLWRAKLLLS